MNLVLCMCFFYFVFVWVCVWHGAVRIRVSRQCCDTIWAEAHKAVATHHTPDVSHAHTYAHTQSHTQGIMLFFSGKKRKVDHTQIAPHVQWVLEIYCRLYCPHPINIVFWNCLCTHIQRLMYMRVSLCVFCCFSYHSSKDKRPRLAVKTWSHLQQQSLNTPKNNERVCECVQVHLYVCTVCSWMYTRRVVTTCLPECFRHGLTFTSVHQG